MKVIHIESGLGNQMLSYAEYLVIEKLNPGDKCYIETIIYDIPECSNIICQWNGYELERIFGIRAHNVKELFSDIQWEQIIESVRKSEFWRHGWRYSQPIVEALNSQGLNLINYIGNEAKYEPEKMQSGFYKFANSKIGYDIKRWLRPFYEKKYRNRYTHNDKIFIKTEENILAGQNLGLKNYGANIEFVESEIKRAFKFPPLNTEQNLKILYIIQHTNSVAIHARRGDMLQSNGYCYRYGYFRRAVKYIKKKVENPVFFFFCDTGSIEWCKKNPKIFGLDYEKDSVYFVDWNKGSESYRDMQLMAACKHNIITNSSFGWWGAYFNVNPNKITCSPNVWMNTTIHL